MLAQPIPVVSMGIRKEEMMDQGHQPEAVAFLFLEIAGGANGKEISLWFAS